MSVKAATRWSENEKTDKNLKKPFLNAKKVEHKKQAVDTDIDNIPQLRRRLLGKVPE